jgi:hypothetical protein
MANEIVVQNAPVTTRLMSVDDAIAEGAMALFGEKYGDEVRVVSMGTACTAPRPTGPIRSSCAAARMCASTGDIGLVRIVSDSAVGAGVRRIEALTGDAARQYLDEQDRRLKAIAGRAEGGAGRRAGARRGADRRAQEARARTDRRAQEACASAAGRRAGAEAAASNRRRRQVPRQVGHRRSPKDLKALADEARSRSAPASSSSARRRRRGRQGERRRRRHRRPDETLQRGRSGRVAAAALGGQGGGGRPDMAQAGGPDGDGSGLIRKRSAAARAPGARGAEAEAGALAQPLPPHHEPAAERALRVGVEDRHAAAGGEAEREVGGERGLAGAALLLGDGDDASGHCGAPPGAPCQRTLRLPKVGCTSGIGGICHVPVIGMPVSRLMTTSSTVGTFERSASR